MNLKRDIGKNIIRWNSKYFWDRSKSSRFKTVNEIGGSKDLFNEMTKQYM